MSIQDIASDTPVADFITYVELGSIQYAFGWNPWVSTRAASQLWKQNDKTVLLRITSVFFLLSLVIYAELSKMYFHSFYHVILLDIFYNLDFSVQSMDTVHSQQMSAMSSFNTIATQMLSYF